MTPATATASQAATTMRRWRSDQVMMASSIALLDVATAGADRALEGLGLEQEAAGGRDLLARLHAFEDLDMVALDQAYLHAPRLELIRAEANEDERDALGTLDRRRRHHHGASRAPQGDLGAREHVGAQDPGRILQSDARLGGAGRRLDLGRQVVDDAHEAGLDAVDRHRDVLTDRDVRQLTLGNVDLRPHRAGIDDLEQRLVD